MSNEPTIIQYPGHVPDNVIAFSTGAGNTHEQMLGAGYAWSDELGVYIMRKAEDK